MNFKIGFSFNIRNDLQTTSKNFTFSLLRYNIDRIAHFLCRAQHCRQIFLFLCFFWLHYHLKLVLLHFDGVPEGQKRFFFGQKRGFVLTYLRPIVCHNDPLKRKWLEDCAHLEYLIEVAENNFYWPSLTRHVNNLLTLARIRLVFLQFSNLVKADINCHFLT